LEANLETTLFIRSANGVSLTERGAHLRERVQDVFAELEQILQDLDRTHEVNGTLTLAAAQLWRDILCRGFSFASITTTRPPLFI
jgi:DNA-binding transcriptional LysR family regulator